MRKRTRILMMLAILAATFSAGGRADAQSTIPLPNRTTTASATTCNTGDSSCFEINSSTNVSGDNAVIVANVTSTSSSNAIYGKTINGNGVKGASTGSAATGVLGLGTSGIGVKGVTNAGGTGVYGSATGTGTKAGVCGEITINGCVNTTNAGVAGIAASSTGVYGVSQGGMGVFGETTLANGGAGVFGKSVGASPGVQGTSTSFGSGVSGSSTSGPGVSGFSAAAAGIGVTGSGSIGVSGITTSNIGVQGTSSAAGAVGIYGLSNATPDGGYGVVGRAFGTGYAIYGDNTNSQGFAAVFSGKAYTTDGMWNGSDVRLKKDVKDLHYGLSDLLKLRPVSYELKAHAGVTRLGLIAQDVQKVIPEVVIEGADIGGAGKMLSINYIDLVPVSIRAIQEQEARIARLERSRPIVSSVLPSYVGGAFALGLFPVGLMAFRRRRREEQK